MDCVNCGAVMRRDITHDCLVCDFCYSAWFPPPDADGVRVFDEAAGVDCPVCHVQLVEASIEGSPIEFCRGCRGVLVQVDTFLVIQASLRLHLGRPGEVPQPSVKAEPLRNSRKTATPAEEADRESLGSLMPRHAAFALERELSCPVCGRRMDTHYYAGPGGVVIDNCPACEMNWLDHGKLQRIVQAPDPPLPDEFTWNPTIGFKT